MSEEKDKIQEFEAKFTNVKRKTKKKKLRCQADGIYAMDPSLISKKKTVS